MTQVQTTETIRPIPQTERVKRVARTRDINDTFRQQSDSVWPLLGRIVVTRGVAELPDVFFPAIMEAVRRFDVFNDDNDPHGEHDFGAVTVSGERIFWKIDYFKRGKEVGSEAPWDVSKTERVLTVMLAEEY